MARKCIIAMHRSMQNQQYLREQQRLPYMKKEVEILAAAIREHVTDDKWAEIEADVEETLSRRNGYEYFQVQSRLWAYHDVWDELNEVD